MTVATRLQHQSRFVLAWSGWHRYSALPTIIITQWMQTVINVCAYFTVIVGMMWC